MKGKVLIMSQFFPPETYAGANRLGPMAEMLAERFEVTVVTVRPSYPSPEDYAGLLLEEHDAALPCRVLRAPAFRPHRGGMVFRTLREQALAARLARRATGPADVVIASSPSMFLGPAGLAAARAKGAGFVWDVRDVTWGYARDIVGHASPVMAAASRALEGCMRRVLRRADLVVGASEGITGMLVEAGADPGRAVTVPNGISSGLLREIRRAVPGPPQAKARPLVAYAGLIGYNQHLGALVEAARALPGADFVVAGDGPELPLLRRRAESLGLANVSFPGYLRREEVLALYRRSDVLFAQARDAPAINAGMVPVKLFEYMAAGRPVVYAGRGLAVELLRRAGCAVTVPPEDPAALRGAIDGLLRSPGLGRELGRRGREFVCANCCRESLMEELSDALEERFFRRGAPVAVVP
ncbi:glycosyl transferase, group 1 [Rubrobacter xylanophilus DSM 9941]|uniref:Glycosyl transferase, group 1 n=1 Tax=Rubrobacter xylanophilus (strain DSM 9941 / JCM 11954 / NBRC 16129 / PRD-1) TaxID=266117 RepID=Q1AUP4_RUBXD|nr:glycosyltransferase family 4 protein [Rubrobacter xylanophilus]ABG04884.1 glycosyl transferase, group 1 [Rubrobacter xylanophilus DSM 9941]